MRLLKALFSPKKYYWGKFYYGNKRAKQEAFSNDPENTCLTLWGERKYNIMSSKPFSKNAGSKWDDLKFLGYGVVKFVKGTDWF